jgi:hypothetical protein
MNLVVLGATGGTGRLVVDSIAEGEATVTVYTILFATALAAVKLLQRPAAVSRGN